MHTRGNVLFLNRPSICIHGTVSRQNADSNHAFSGKCSKRFTPEEQSVLSHTSVSIKMNLKCTCGVLLEKSTQELR